MSKLGKIIVITGMHRSGTSLTSSLLQSSGLNIGERLMGASSANVKGHFENLDFVNFHEKVLLSQGISKEGWCLENNIRVQEQYVDKAKLLVKENAVIGNWGWKDPRTTLFLDFWADLLPQANFLLVYRSPWEVVDSLYRRGDEIFYSNPKFAIQIWINYNKKILEFYNQFSERCALLNIQNIARDPAVLSKLMEQKLDVTLNNSEKNIYNESLMNRQVSNSHRPKLIECYFPEAVDLYYELEVIADIKSSSQLGCETLHDESRCIDWVFQDWLDIRKTEKNSKLELKALESQLQQTQIELQNYQSQLQQTQIESQNYQSQLQQTQIELQNYQSQLQQTQIELQNYQSQLQQTQIEVVRSQVKIVAMESSKFWKLRTIWCRIKKWIVKV